MKPILFVMSGVPGSGKSTLSRYIAKKYKMVYLRVDTLEQGLRELCHLDVIDEGYELAYRIAGDHLKLGIPVLVDSCNPILLTRKRWGKVAEDNDSFLVNIEVICSDRNEHRKRIETRVTDVENLKLPTWEEVENREFHPWGSERIRVDTAHKSIEESQKELDEAIHKYLKQHAEVIISPVL